ncbi:glycosyltransferase family 2 protein [Vibrio mexicanus]|uniref:glycosyltransferase family 2 protein n=1 Tax=Vibrio mexicanus TaxID=1004326 RepID=UPI0012F9F85B|nr:glycosyltransferase family 2 protein [Vibrio mexicanus]
MSHGHEQLISKLNSLAKLQKHRQVTVLCRDNLQSEALRSYCSQYSVSYQASGSPQGFSANNNANYLWAQSLGMSSSDYFVLLNPDVDIDIEAIEQLITQCVKQDLSLVTINLFINKKRTVFDDNLRRYPTLLTFFKNYCLKDRSTVLDKSNPSSFDEINYWASGAFLIFNADLYEQLNGLDESYFLYCEDIDICKRALKLGHKPVYLHEVTAIHYRRCKSRKFLSKEFFYHVHSVLLLTIAKWGMRSTKSRIHTSSKSIRALTFGDKSDERA